MAKDILVDIDALFDTRYPIFLGLDGNSTSDSIMDKNYYNRNRDNLNNVSYWVMKAFYRNRDKSILGTALPTGIFGLLRDHLAEIKTDLLNQEVKDLTIKLYVNIYPYMLNQEELLNLARYITGMLGYVDIQFISFTMEDITPEWITSNVGSYYSYSAPEWLEVQFANLNILHRPILDIMVFGPGIFTMSTDGNKVELNHIVAFEERMKLVCDYHAIPLTAFCGLIF